MFLKTTKTLIITQKLKNKSRYTKTQLRIHIYTN